MNNSLKYLTLLLVGATLACAETKPPKESVKPVPASHPAAEQGAAPATGKPGTAKPNADGRLIEVGYGVKRTDAPIEGGRGLREDRGLAVGYVYFDTDEENALTSLGDAPLHRLV